MITSASIDATVTREMSLAKVTGAGIAIFNGGKVVYLSHPDAKELSLGCRGRDYSNELYAKSDGRKPKPAFY